MVDSQMRKVKFGQRLKAGSKQADVGVQFFTTYHPKLKKIIIIFVVMINASFTFWPAKHVRNKMQEKQLIDLDYDGITIKKAMWNS